MFDEANNDTVRALADKAYEAASDSIGGLNPSWTTLTTEEQRHWIASVEATLEALEIEELSYLACGADVTARYCADCAECLDEGTEAD